MHLMFLNSVWGKKLPFKLRGEAGNYNDIVETLKFAYEYTIENDLPGYFFEVTEADSDYISGNNVITFTNRHGVRIMPYQYEIWDLSNVIE